MVQIRPLKYYHKMRYDDITHTHDVVQSFGFSCTLLCFVHRICNGQQHNSDEEECNKNKN